MATPQSNCSKKEDIDTVTVDQLKENYAVINDNLYGECLVIPAKEFGAAWSEELKAQGCKIFQGMANGRAAFFVKLPGAAPTPSEEVESRTVYEPPETPPAAKKRQHTYGEGWTTEEDKELIKGVTLGLTNKEISERIPGRSPVAVQLRKVRLRKHGLVPKPGKKQGRPRGRPKKAETVWGGGGSKPYVPLAPASPSVTTTTPAPSSPALKPFPEAWEAAKQYGQDIDGLAEEVYNECVKAKLPQPIIEALLRMFAEIQGHINFLTDNKVDQEQLNKTNILFRQHKHVDGHIFVPLEVQ